jgi:hypothetical protein
LANPDPGKSQGEDELMLPRSFKNFGLCPKVIIVRWGPISEPRLKTYIKTEFIQSLQNGFFLHNYGTETALSVQLEKLEIACGPERSISITSEPVNIESGKEAFMPVRWENPPSPLDRHNLIGALNLHYDFTHRDKTELPRTMTILISYTYKDWHDFSYRVKSNMIFSIAHPNGILRFEILNVEPIASSEEVFAVAEDAAQKSQCAELSPVPVTAVRAEPTMPMMQNIFEVEGEMVHIRFAGQEVGMLNNSKGMKYLAHLVKHSGQEFATVQEFYAAVFGADPNLDKYSAGEDGHSEGFRSTSYLPVEIGSDRESLRLCKEELREINEKLASLDHDVNRDPLARKELDERKDKILEVIKVLSIGKSRKSELDRETAKLTNAVRQAAFRAIECLDNATDGQGKPLANHFSQILKPFRFPLSYNPQPSIRWNE